MNMNIYMSQVSQLLTYMSSDELKDLLNSDDKIEERVNDATQSLEKEKEEIMVENRIKAEENLAREPQLIELRGRVNDLSQEGKSLYETVEQKLGEIKSKSGSMSQDTALALLQTAAAESEEESESIVKQFMDNEINVDNFLESFQAARKIMHLRKLKADKMNELMRNSTTNSAGYPAYPVPGSVPYPMGPMPMPMPGFRHF
ncbi:vacuolar protein sorting-associated protein 37B [Phlebotomus argentipes]|uniref:vacuolar protein sorting-associated protein 37B n=1 Tax=Phlebotomus argentipes TaxID=94469 RepID=UPI002892D6B2|nr:vacuolar protein sorting-associated protein 37B [Phlebotomus argentipes]